VLPCLNEADSLARLLPALEGQLKGCVRAWEVIVVDDGSRDDTLQLLAAWAQRPGFRVLLLARNFGKEAALTAGLQAARGDVVVTMDADGQHAPALIPQMLERWRAGADMVYTQRPHRNGETFVKRAGAGLFYRLLNAMQRFEVPAGAGDFRLLDRSVVDALLSLPERTRFMKGLYAWVGFQTAVIEDAPPPRTHGRSRFSLRALTSLSVLALTAFTTWPLRAVSATGAVTALAAFGYGAYLTGDYLLHGHEVSGWTTIVVTLLLSAGLQLLAIGVVGEYIGRIFDEVKARPLYIVRRELGRGLDAR
jgi:glycosyltransferase involved in cell wall biosynthesis